MSERQTLYQHVFHPHQPQNINDVHHEELQGVNARFAVWLTKHVGTMACAYLFAVIGICGLVGAFTNNTSLVLIFGSISSYFLQLVLLPVILVGGNVLNRKQELQADEDFLINQKSFTEIGQIVTHLDKQDEAILTLVKKMEEQQTSIDLLLLKTPGNTASGKTKPL